MDNSSISEICSTLQEDGELCSDVLEFIRSRRNVLVDRTNRENIRKSPNGNRSGTFSSSCNNANVASPQNVMPNYAPVSANNENMYGGPQQVGAMNPGVAYQHTSGLPNSYNGSENANVASQQNVMPNYAPVSANNENMYGGPQQVGAMNPGVAYQHTSGLPISYNGSENANVASQQNVMPNYAPVSANNENMYGGPQQVGAMNPGVAYQHTSGLPNSYNGSENANVASQQNVMPNYVPVSANNENMYGGPKQVGAMNPGVAYQHTSGLPNSYNGSENANVASQQNVMPNYAPVSANSENMYGGPPQVVLMNAGDILNSNVLYQNGVSVANLYNTGNVNVASQQGVRSAPVPTLTNNGNLYANSSQVVLMNTSGIFNPNILYQHGTTLLGPINNGNLYAGPPQVAFMNPSGISNPNVFYQNGACVANIYNTRNVNVASQRSVISTFGPTLINNENLFASYSQVGAINHGMNRNTSPLLRSSGLNVANDADLRVDISPQRMRNSNVANDADLRVDISPPRIRPRFRDSNVGNDADQRVSISPPGMRNSNVDNDADLTVDISPPRIRPRFRDSNVGNDADLTVNRGEFEDGIRTDSGSSCSGTHDSLSDGTSSELDEELFNNNQLFRSKQEFVKQFSSVSKKLKLGYVVTEDFITGCDTERSNTAIWLYEPEQTNFFNPSGRMYTLKSGKEITSGGRYCSTYICTGCKSVADARNYRKIYADYPGCSIVGFKGFKKRRGPFSHDPGCSAETLQERIGYSARLKTSKDSAKRPISCKSAFVLNSELVGKICQGMNWGIGVSKTKLGLYSGSIGRTARQRKYLAGPKVDKTTFEFPQELKFVDPIVDGKSHEPFHIYGRTNSHIIVFGSDTLLKIYAKSEVRMGDGTFWITPKGFRQVYTIIVVINEEKRGEKRRKYIPVVFAIMKKKSKELYELLFKIIRKRLQKLELEDIPPVVFLTDKEEAVVRIIDEFYPGTHKLCYFHMCQSFTKKLQTVGLIKMLINVRKKNSDESLKAKKFYSFFRKTICIPFLPKELMKKMWNQLKREVTNNWRNYLCESFVLQQLKSFVAYVDDWFGEEVTDTELNKICKWKQVYRTTNACEAINKLMKNSPYAKKKGTVENNAILLKSFDEQSRLMVYKFDSFRDKEEFAFEPQSKSCIEKERLIRHYQEQLEASNMQNVETYLNKIIKVMMPRSIQETVNYTLNQLEYLETPEQRVENNNEEVEQVVEELAIRTNVSQDQIEDAMLASVLLDVGDNGTETQVVTTRSGRTVRRNSQYFNRDYITRLR
uniref:MULE domain-containing protein n=1 Tax=Strongyloides papillosus TaxID=174720 RepID=A0A0N5C1C7_STREA